MKPLSRQFRSLTLWCMVLVFILGTPILIGYSIGYRLDDALSLIQTGGIYIHSDMSNTTVYLDGDFVEANGVLLKNTLIQDLTPNKSYELWVEKAGYQSWVKVLTVRANLVTEATVLMLPTEFEWTVVPATSTLAVASDPLAIASSTSSSTEVANPSFVELTETFADDKDQFAVDIATTTYEYVRGKRVATSTIIREIDFPTWLEGLASSSALKDKTMVRERDGIVAWLDSGNLYATWARENDVAPYYFCNATCTPILSMDWVNDIHRFEFYPNRNDVVIVDTGTGIFAVELDNRSQRNIQVIYDAPVVDFRLLQDGTLVVFDGEVYRETSW